MTAATQRRCTRRARLASAAGAWLLCLAAAGAEPLPPPDPRKGERPDARIRGRLPGADVALAVPRLILTPPRLIVGVIAQAVRGVLQLDHERHVAKKFARLFTTGDGLVGVRPIIRFVSAFTPQGGFAFFDERSLGPRSRWGFSLVAGLPEVIIADLDIERSYGRRLQWRVGSRYVRRDDQLFSGIGLASFGDSRPNDFPRSRFGIDSVEVPIELDVQFNTKWNMRISEVWNFRHYRDGRDRFDPPISRVYCDPMLRGDCRLAIVDPDRVPRFDQGANFFRSDIGFVYDSRGTIPLPRSGARIEAGVSYAAGVGRDTSSWVHARAAVTGAITLGRGETRVLLLRLAGEMVEPIGKGVVPFTELVTLGGPDTLRGFPIGRFRNFSSVLLTAEYRWTVWMWMDAVVFTDLGGVFGRNFEGFAFDRLVPDVGLGVRVRTKSRFLMRAHVAYGFAEGVQAMFATSTGF